MFGLFASRAATPPIRRSFPKRSRPSRAENDLEALLARMRQRQYPETIPVLSSFWLKTVYASGYTRHQWRELNRLLKSALLGPMLAGPSREAIREIQNWIEQTIVLKDHAPECRPPRFGPLRPRLDSERLTPYLVRLLNEWMPVELARRLLDESECGVTHAGGIPVLAIGGALERLLVREHLSPGTLEMLIEPGRLSPEYVYPADLEILRDVVLSLLGRTGAPAPSIMPAASLCLAPQSQLRADYGESLRKAFAIRRVWSEEVRVPVAPEQAREILQHEGAWIGSIIVTMDGRSWEAQNLQGGEQYCVVYRPAGRLRIDHSCDHARLKVPWPENRLRWSGSGDFSDRFKIFGREWRVAKFEADGERTWFHLEFFRMLPISEMVPGADRGPWQLRPASVDMAWTALGSALTRSLIQKSSEPIEQLRQSDLIPLGRSIMGFAQSLIGWRLQTRKAIETHLRALRYLQSPIVSEYGRVPWRILPGPVRAAFLKVARHPPMRELLNEVLEGLPDSLGSGGETRRAAAAM